MQQNTQKHQHKELGQKHLVNILMIVKIKGSIIILFLISFFVSNTATGAADKTSSEIVKDLKSVCHYSTCIYTKITYGDPDLD